jgi:hypothetical protein
VTPTVAHCAAFETASFRSVMPKQNQRFARAMLSQLLPRLRSAAPPHHAPYSTTTYQSSNASFILHLICCLLQQLLQVPAENKRPTSLCAAFATGLHNDRTQVQLTRRYLRVVPDTRVA